MSERSFAFHPWALTVLLRPALFGVALAAGVLAGEQSDSFWIGLLAFFVASAAGRASRRLVRGRLADAVYELLWPAAATGFAFLFVDAGLPNWAAVLLAAVAGGVAKEALATVFLPRRGRRERWLRPEEWGVASPADVIQGRWKEKEER